MSRVIVIGGGIVGVTSAWALVNDGHEVTLLEAGQDIAGQTSYANGGQIAVSDSAPWATPSVPFKVMRWLGRNDAPFRLRPRLDITQWHWLYLFLLNCRGRALSAGTERNLRLATYSLSRLQQTRSTLGNEFSYDDSQKGIIRLIDSQKEADAARHYFAKNHKDEKLIWMEPSELVAKDSAFMSAVERNLIAGAVMCASDESGDARIFAKKLAAELENRGVEIHTDCKVTDFVSQRGCVKGVSTEKGGFSADRVVLSSGVASRALARKIGMTIPVLPVKGYSVTVPIIDENRVPIASCTDLKHRLVISRLGMRLRVAGFAEIGSDEVCDTSRAAAARDRLEELFPNAADYQSFENWTGFRPMTPDGAPIIGEAETLKNVWFNTGHGTLGWTLSHGTAQLLTDMIAGRETALDVKPYKIKRSYVSDRLG